MSREGNYGLIGDVFAILWEVEALTDEQFLAALARLDDVPPMYRTGEYSEKIERKVKTQ